MGLPLTGMGAAVTAGLAQSPTSGRTIAPMQPKSKTLAAWLALLAGSLGAHRFYLYGWHDLLAWLHPVPTLLGLAGVIRMRNLGQDDLAAWLLIPLLGLMLAQAMLFAIIHGLTPDERWAQRWQPGYRDGQAVPSSGWPAVIAVIIALLVGGGVLMGTLAFGGQKYFEYQALREASPR